MASSKQNVFDPYSAENLSALEDKLSVSLKNKELLKTAISTRAARNEHPDIIKEDNERLEFLCAPRARIIASVHLLARP